MPGRNRRTNLLLLLVMILICISCAFLFRQSTAYPSKVEGGTVRLFVSQDTEKQKQMTAAVKQTFLNLRKRFHLQQFLSYTSTV